MIAMLNESGTCLGLYSSMEEVKQVQSQNPCAWLIIEGEGIVIFRTVNSLEELQDLMDQAARFHFCGESEPI